MFTKINKDEEKKTLVPKVPAPPSLLSKDLKISGNLITEGELQIDGEVVGDIQADVLIVGESANVNGEITAISVRIHGRVTGQVNAQIVSLAKTARVLGDVLHENLAIEQGAHLEGHCRRAESSGKKESENPISLLVKGSSKTKLEPPPKKSQAEASA